VEMVVVLHVLNTTLSVCASFVIAHLGAYHMS